MPPKLAISLHLYHLGIFLFTEKRRKKRISSGFVGCFFGFHVFLTGVFLVEQCLERETDTKTSPTLDFALRRGPRERKALMTYLTLITRCVCVLAFTSTESHPCLLLVRILRLIPRTLSSFFELLSTLFFCLLEEMGIFGDPSCTVYWERRDADENEVTILMIINNLGSLNGPPWRFAPSGSR
jgi:hypothetical protein